MKLLSLSALVSVFTLTASPVSANDLMNYGELSLFYSHSSDTEEIKNTNPSMTTPDDESDYWEETVGTFKFNSETLSLKLSTDFNDYFFGGVIVSDLRADNELYFNGETQRSKANGTATAFFVGGAYHFDQNTHLFGVVTHSTFKDDDISDSDVFYRVGAKKAWGKFIGTIEKTTKSFDDALPLTLTGKYYFSRNLFAGASVMVDDSDTRTGFTLGYTF